MNLMVNTAVTAVSVGVIGAGVSKIFDISKAKGMGAYWLGCTAAAFAAKAVENRFLPLLQKETSFVIALAVVQASLSHMIGQITAQRTTGTDVKIRDVVFSLGGFVAVAVPVVSLGWTIANTYYPGLLQPEFRGCMNGCYYYINK